LADFYKSKPDQQVAREPILTCSAFISDAIGELKNALTTPPAGRVSTVMVHGDDEVLAKV
jgi:hypothetical protein